MSVESTAPERKATGPRTIAGKRRSRMNAIKHGFYSKHLLLDGEDPAEYEKLHRDLRNDWQPVGRSMDLEAEWLATLYWRRGEVPQPNLLLSRGHLALWEHSAELDLPRQELLRAGLKDGSTPVKPENCASAIRCSRN